MVDTSPKKEVWYYDGQSISVVSSDKYLGLFLTTRMTFSNIVVFSHNEANAICIVSGRPGSNPANHETSNSEWNTYYTGKLQNTLRERVPFHRTHQRNV